MKSTFKGYAPALSQEIQLSCYPPDFLKRMADSCFLNCALDEAEQPRHNDFRLEEADPRLYRGLASGRPEPHNGHDH